MNDKRFHIIIKWWHEMNQTNVDHIYKKIERTIQSETSRRRRINIVRKITIAAVIILVAGGGSTWLLMDKRSSSQIPLIGRIDEKATLTMPDGSRIIINKSTDQGLIASEENIDIIHKDGSLIYEPKDAGEATGHPEIITYSLLSIPKGMTFEVTLQDGTRVWLNADSKLHFPTVFGKNERRVKLEGEGYFDVAENPARPFVLETACQEITVLGTQFNVCAYPNEEREYTTLVEGSVSLTQIETPDHILLKPGQQAIIHTGGSDHIRVREINTEDIASWRDEIFLFDGCTLGEVFTKLSRWYDFDYQLDSRVESRVFRGNLPVYQEVNPVFAIIERVAQVEIVRKSDVINIHTKL